MASSRVRQPRRAKRAGGATEVLFGLDHQPAGIAGAAQPAENRREIQMTVAGHGEDAVEHGIEEAGIGRPRPCRDRRPDVLAVNVAEPRAVPGDDGVRRAAGRIEMPGIEQKRHVRARRRHQPVDLVGRLDHRAEVVVIAKPEALAARLGRQAVEPCREFRQLERIQDGAGRERAGAIALDRPAHLGEDEGAAAHGPKQRQMRPHGLDLRVHAAFQQPGAMPAGGQAQAMELQQGAQNLGLARKLPAELHARVARLARLVQAGRERNVAPQLRQVVVRPAHRIDRQLDLPGHGPAPQPSIRRCAVAAS